MNFGKIGEFFLGKGGAGEGEDLIAKYLKGIADAGGRVSKCSPIPPELIDPYIELPRETQVHLIAAAMRRAAALEREMEKLKRDPKSPEYKQTEERRYELFLARWQLVHLMEVCLRKRLPFEEKAVKKLVSWALEQSYLSSNYVPINGILSAVENFSEETALTEDFKEQLKKFSDRLDPNQGAEVVRKFRRRLEQLYRTERRQIIDKGEPWSDFAIASLETLPIEEREAWADLLELCVDISGAKPSARLMARIEEIVVKRIGMDKFRDKVLSWFPLITQRREISTNFVWTGRSSFLISGTNGDILKGLALACKCAPSREMNRGLAQLVLDSYKKFRGVGSILPKVGSAGIMALASSGDVDAFGQLAVLKMKIRLPAAQKAIEKALLETAKKRGMSHDEVEELSVPVYGLTGVGSATVRFGEISVELKAVGSRVVDLVWKDGSAKVLKSAPASVKKDFASELKEFKLMQKEVEQMLGAQAERIDQLFRYQRSWSLADWTERYLEHPLVGVIARRIIWKFEGGGRRVLAIWRDGRLENLFGESVSLEPNMRVELWHPIESSTDEVRCWRERIELLEIKQPFKQAHREIYLLTPAEETTGVYSNRFAGHVLKQHQFHALCGQRGWKNKLRLMVDDDYRPTHRVLRDWGLRAEFWVEGVGSEYGTDTTDVGTFLYIATDQVRFYREDAPERSAHARGGGYRLRRQEVDEPLPLRDIPKKVFSEVMRDVDLFVGVCSVGNDPSWTDGGRETRYQEYWSSYSFGELSGSAANRKEILERLVPKLKIGSKCRFSDKFLIVKGILHEYKIHLGSGNILMSPNDQYLCIVQKQSVAKKDEVFLPFEGDRTLSVILSKAFLLAADDKITDRTILAQIK